MAWEYWNMQSDVLTQPPFMLEQGTRQTAYSMEGTTVMRTFGINNYTWHKRFAHWMCGGVNPVNPQLRLWPQRDSYFSHCYCLEWTDRLIGETEGAPLAGSDEIQLQTANDNPWRRTVLGNISGAGGYPFYANIRPRGQSGGLASEPDSWEANETPLGGAWLTFSYRDLKAPFIAVKGGAIDNRYIGHYDLDFVDFKTDAKVNSIQVSDFALGPRINDVRPTKVFDHYQGSHGAVSTATTGIEVKRLFVPAYTEEWIRKHLLIVTLGKINEYDMYLPGATSQCGQNHAFFRAQTLRFDDWHSIPHQDPMGRVFYTIIMNFSENHDIGAKRSGHFGKRIGWNSLYDPHYYGFMRVSGKKTRSQWWDLGFWGAGGNYDVSLYELTIMFPWLFRIYTGGEGADGSDEPTEGP